MSESLNNWHKKWDAILHLAMDACEHAERDFRSTVHMTAPLPLHSVISGLRETLHMKEVNNECARLDISETKAPHNTLGHELRIHHKNKWKPIPEGYLTVAEAESQYEISGNCIREAVKNGNLPSIKTDRLLIPKQEFEAFAARKRN